MRPRYLHLYLNATHKLERGEKKLKLFTFWSLFYLEWHSATNGRCFILCSDFFFAACVTLGAASISVPLPPGVYILLA